MFIKGGNTATIEFGLNLGKVKVSGYMRNGNWVKGFTQKRLLAGKELAEDIVIKGKGGITDIVEGAANSGDLRTRQGNAKLAAKGILYAIRNPSKAVREGFEREQLMLQAIAVHTGKDMSRKDVILAGVDKGIVALDDMLEDPAFRKDMIINTGGFVASRAAGLTGIPGMGLAGDLAGAKITRKAFNDKETLAKALTNLQGDNAYNESNRLSKIGQIFSESKRLMKERSAESRIEGAGDVGGWAAGNLAASVTGGFGKLPGTPIPIAGPTAGALGAKLAENIAKISPPLSYNEALAEIIGKSISDGNRRETYLREKIEDNWEIVKKLGDYNE